jgi:hypothetical protein
MDIILELMNGKIFEATLANLFVPEEIKSPWSRTGKKEKFRFTEICCLHLKSYQLWLSLFQKDTLPEEVTTVLGKTYLVHVSEKTQPYSTGFFGLLVRKDTPYRLMFFTSLGVKTRCQTRAVSEVIADDADMPQDYIENTLANPMRSGKILHAGSRSKGGLRCKSR